MTAADRPDASFLALDLGGTKLAVRAVRAGRVVESVARWPRADGDVEPDLVVLRGTVTRALRDLDAAPDRVALAAAPTIDATGVVRAWPSRPHWASVPLLPLLRDLTGAPVVGGDDASLAALAEAHGGACPDLVYLGIGTGVGGGIVSGGRLVVGAWGGAGEFGHLVTDPGGAPCRCGRAGCLQAETCADALADRASRRRGVPTTPAEWVAGVARRCPWAEHVLDHAAGVLAGALAMIGEIVQPARVHVGGGLGAALPGLPDRIEARLAGLARPGRPVPEVRPAVHGERSSLAGAELLAVRGVGILGEERVS